MFSLFHKDGPKPGPQKAGEQVGAPGVEAGIAAVRGVESSPIPLGPDAPAAGIMPPVAAAFQGKGEAAAEPSGLDRQDATFGLASLPRENSQTPEADDEATSADSTGPWADQEGEEWPADDDDQPPDQGPTGEPERPSSPRNPPRPQQGRQLRLPEAAKRQEYTPQQRLLLLDTWRRSGLPGQDFAGLVGVSKYTLYKWKQRFQEQGPAGLMDQPRGGKTGSRLPELTKRTILMLKEQHPEWGCQRISDLLLRGPALPASASAVARVLHEAGYEAAEETTHPHPDRERRFERAQPNQLWQTDLFTFVLKRQNRRVYLVAFMDDHSRFLVSYGLHASQSTALVLEVLEAGIANYGPPEEILTDNGAQYVTWRGKSQFTKRLEQRGIRQLVSRPQRPQTLGKIERFWGTLWREFLETAVFADLAEARTRIGHFIDYYNFQRPHRGAEGLVPADRFFQAAPTVLQTLKERVVANALELARYGQPKSPFYVTGQVAGQTFSVHSEGERLVLRRQGQEREEIELTSPGSGSGSTGGVSPVAQASEPLPKPLCPDGSPCPGVGEPACARALAPGQTGLDLASLAEATRGSHPELAADGALPRDGHAKRGGTP